MVSVGTGMEMLAGVTSNGADSEDTTASSSMLRLVAHGGMRNGTLQANFSGDLWKSLLKSEQAKSTCDQTHSLPSPLPMGLRKPLLLPVPMAR